MLIRTREGLIMSYRVFDYLVPNVNFFGPNAISVVGERCKLLGGL